MNNHNIAHTNRLIGETSPYLLQHAHNPVQWYPWGEEALDKARREDKPILLSIGYSACHWCHVMAHESFEDEETAAVMNALFVNIKVDREERPDLDKIYQAAHQLLAQRSGGWPLTMILTPDDQTPFFGGTYFPPAPRHGLPGFKDLLRRVEAFYRENRDDIKQQNSALARALEEMTFPGDTVQSINAAPLDIARRQLEQSFDAQHGGFGRAPKFPHPTHIERLLRHWAATGRVDDKALSMACVTLARMAEGGLYDQLGGGFCRYSVDEWWMIPHFEKMLYDNGPLLALYSEAWLATRDPLFKQVAEETAAWVMREMQSPEGGYYSTLDADSEGHEGKFYIWDPQQVRALLNDEEYAVFARRYGLDQPANFEGQWHLHVQQGIAALSSEFSMSEMRINTLLDAARAKLFVAREQRIRPGRDEKILTAWNGLMIKGMTTAGRHLGRPECLASAQRALDFIRAHLWRDGRLLASHKDGRSALAAYLDDYVFLIDGILELLQARWRDGDLSFAVALAEAVLTHFEDKERGGFFFTADDHERLIHRPKPLGDDALPAGNGIAAHVLGRLGHLLGEPRYLDAAARTLTAAWPAVTRIPYAHNALLLALEEYLYPPQTIILRGPSADLPAWQALCGNDYAPRRITLAIPAEAADLPGVLAQRGSASGVIAYVCEGLSCGAPFATREALKRAVANGR